jgi:hypothetical protein
LKVLQNLEYLSHIRKKKHNVCEQIQENNARLTRQKRKGKVSDLISAKSKVIIAHEMWTNTKRVCKQLHKNKNNIKSRKVERKNMWRLSTSLIEA